MSRSLYLIAGLLGAFAMVAGGLSLMPSSHQPGLPTVASLWRTGGLFLALGALGAALIGVMSHLFEQVDRRGEERRQAARRARRSRAPSLGSSGSPGRDGNRKGPFPVE